VETSQRIVDTLLRAPRARNSPANSCCEPGHHEQSHLWRRGRAARRRPVCLLRNDCRRRRRRVRLRRQERDAQPHDEYAQHAHRSPRTCIPRSCESLCGASRVRRPGRKFRGGDGIIREIEMLSSAQVAVLSDRRKIPPYGLSGGSPGAEGKTEIVVGGRVKRLPSKCTLYAPAGTIVRIETPEEEGGGKSEGRTRAGRKEKASKRSRLEAFQK